MNGWTFSKDPCKRGNSLQDHHHIQIAVKMDGWWAAGMWIGEGYFYRVMEWSFLRMWKPENSTNMVCCKGILGNLNFFVPTFSHLINMTNAQMFVFVEHYLCLLFCVTLIVCVFTGCTHSVCTALSNFVCVLSVSTALSDPVCVCSVCPQLWVTLFVCVQCVYSFEWPCLCVFSVSTALSDPVCVCSVCLQLWVTLFVCVAGCVYSFEWPCLCVLLGVSAALSDPVCVCSVCLQLWVTLFVCAQCVYSFEWPCLCVFSGSTALSDPVCVCCRVRLQLWVTQFVCVLSGFFLQLWVAICVCVVRVCLQLWVTLFVCVLAGCAHSVSTTEQPWTRGLHLHS